MPHQQKLSKYTTRIALHNAIWNPISSWWGYYTNCAKSEICSDISTSHECDVPNKWWFVKHCLMEFGSTVQDKNYLKNTWSAKKCQTYQWQRVSSSS